MINRIKIEVTVEDVLIGAADHWSLCPVARAINRRLKSRYYAEIGPAYSLGLNICDRGIFSAGEPRSTDKRYVGAALPELAESFIKSLMSDADCLRLSPFLSAKTVVLSFDLHLPDRFTA